MVRAGDCAAIQRFHAKLGEDLRAITMTSESHEQCVKLILETILQTSLFMGIGWLSVPTSGVVSLDEALFANAKIDDAVTRTELIDFATSVAIAQTTQAIDSDQIQGMQFIGLPIYVDETTTGVLAGVAARSKGGIDRLAALLQWIASNYDLWRAREQMTSLAGEVRSAATVLELVERAQAAPTQKAACMLIVNELQRFFRCDQVAIGLRSARQQGTRLAAMSSVAEYDSRTKTTALFQNAFDEAIQHDGYTAFPARETSSTGTLLSHKKLAGQLRSTAAISMTLRDTDQEIVGAITILGDVSLDRNASTRNLIHALEHPVGSTVAAIRRAEGGFVQKAAKLFASQQRKAATWVGYAVAAGVLLGMFAPVPYRVTCNCIAEPVLRSYIAAPWDGLLESTDVEPGVIVNAGQRIGAMDGREIRIEKSALVAEREAASRQYDTHLANREIADADRARLDEARLANEIALIEHRETSLQILSPVDGIVLSGSLDRRENYPVARGETIYEIAPLNPLRIEIAVPDNEVMHLSVGQRVRFRFDGFGSQVHDAEIKVIRPDSTIRDDENVFIAEVEINNDDGLIRPGMEGKARVYAGTSTLAWNVFHHPWEKFTTAIGF